mgnify:CR=1 FL=1
MGMQPTPSVVVLGDRIADEHISEQKEVYRLCKYDEVIHLVEYTIGDIYPMNYDDNNAHHISNDCQPFLHIIFKWCLSVNAVNSINRISIIYRLDSLDQIAHIQNLSLFVTIHSYRITTLINLQLPNL